MSGRAYLFIAFMSTDDPGKDRTTARAAKRISEETAQGPGGSRIGTSSTPKEATKKGSSSHTADPTAHDLGQLTYRHLLQDRTHGLTAENASNDLSDNRKYRALPSSSRLRWLMP